MVRINDLWLNEWFLLTSGDYQKNHFNTMTVAWGYFGILWNKPCAVVFVRPTRYTYEFINQYDTFTLCAFNESYKDDLSLLGTKSGRDGDKIAETKLNIIPSDKIPAPSFQEAELIIECRKIYWDDLKPENFIDQSIEKNYSLKDYHRFYFGEILEIRGIEDYKFG
jgi:flavin reductase (DIM6/NTAB) family NADH-FMN oxidoreductase RutF